MVRSKRFGVVAAVLGLAVLGVAAVPGSAKAWWVGGGGWRGGVRVGVVLPPVLMAPPIYAAPPVAYAPGPHYAPQPYYAPPHYYGWTPRPVWVPGHWRGGYWVPGHRA